MELVIDNKDFPKEGDVWLVKFEKLKEFSKPYRPCVVVSNNFQNEFDTKIVVVATTTDDLENIQLFEVFIQNTPENGLAEPSKIILNRPFTVFRELRLEKRLGAASRETMEKVKVAWKISFDVENW